MKNGKNGTKTKTAKSGMNPSNPLSTTQQTENVKNLFVAKGSQSAKMRKTNNSHKKSKKSYKIYADEVDWERRTWQFVFGPKKRLTILKKQPKSRSERVLTSEEAKSLFETWFLDHINDKSGPYPNKETRKWMTDKTRIPQLQIQRWFGQRRRLQILHWKNGQVDKPNWI